MFRKEDIAQIEQRGTTVQNVEQQVERFRKGFPWMKIRCLTRLLWMLP